MSNLVFPLTLLGAVLDKREPYAGVRVDEAASGKELRSTWWTIPRYRYRVRFDVLRSDARKDFQAAATFFARHFGQLSDFLIVDPEDNAVTSHGFGVGDGATTAFQLQRSLLGDYIIDILGGRWAASSKPRTNLCTWSEQLNNAAWTKTAATIGANYGVAPDGHITADMLIEDSTNAGHRALSAAISLTSGVKYVYSVFAKPNGRNRILIADANSGLSSIYDLTNGVVSVAGANATSFITPCGAGWYRCSFGITSGVTGSSNLQLQLALDDNSFVYTGGGSLGVLLWGAQVEVAPSADTLTQYIPTTSAAVTAAPAYWPATTDGFEPITEVAPGQQVFVDGVAKSIEIDYTATFNTGSFPTLTGAITFAAAPANGAVLSWTGSYYRRVRFAQPGLALDKIVPAMWSHAGLELVSVK